MIRDALHDFPAQFAFEPEIKNAEYFRPARKFIVCGMGGSHLAADLLKIWKPELDIVVHEDYGLPDLPAEDLKERLIILSSYSGNTEEVIDSFHAAQEKGFSMTAISIGGTLLELAEKHSIPYVQIPDTGIQPRMALGFSAKAFLKVVGEEEALREISSLGQTLRAENFEENGKTLAAGLRDSIPVIYSSRRNYGIAYNWKIKFNETGKIPAFMNVLPELNHNEMTGWDIVGATRDLSRRFYFIFLRDEADDPRIQKRMDVLEKLYTQRGLRVEGVALGGESSWEKIFSSLLMADWAAYYTAEGYHVEAEQVPMVEEFKKMIAS